MTTRTTLIDHPSDIPSGFHVVLGFADKLRFMNVLMEDLKLFRDLQIKSCKEIRFSSGGQYFAAANVNSIQVYNTYSCQLIANLRGHNNRVRGICWTKDDSALISTGEEAGSPPS